MGGESCTVLRLRLMRRLAMSLKYERHVSPRQFNSDRLLAEYPPTFDDICRPPNGIKFSNIHAFNRLTCACAVLLRQLVCSRVGGVAQLSRTIAVSSALSVEMLQSVADRWRCSKMVWESKVPRRSPIQLLAEPNLA